MTTDRETMTLERFGHHPDPAIDFCVEVEALLGELENRRIGLTNGTPSLAELSARIERAMAFRVGGDANAVLAKQQLRQAHLSRAAEPVAWMHKDTRKVLSDAELMAIPKPPHPHSYFAQGYTIPLYTHPSEYARDLDAKDAARFRFWCGRPQCDLDHWRKEIDAAMQDEGDHNG